MKKELAAILSLVKKDKELRKKAQETGDYSIVKSFDLAATKELKNFLSTFSWPSAKDIGMAAFKGLWLLTVHADKNKEFQRKALLSLKALFKKERKSAYLPLIAQLEDRILFNAQKKQKYGTQFKRNSDGTLALWPVVGMKDVDERRKSVGLGPIEKDLKDAERHNKKIKK